MRLAAGREYDLCDGRDVSHPEFVDVVELQCVHLGSYAGNGLPGPLTNTPTILYSRDEHGVPEFWNIVGVTNGVLDSAHAHRRPGRARTSAARAPNTIGCSNLTLSSCVVSNNGVLGSGSTYRYVGGIYAALNTALY